MSEHLPECNVIAGDGMCGICQEDRCVCDRLRACELRTLSAARDAVAALPIILYNNAVYDTDPPDVRHAVDLDDALAAIDALRGDA